MDYHYVCFLHETFFIGMRNVGCVDSEANNHRP